MSAIETMKKDFNEFTETMKHDMNELSHQLQAGEKPFLECVTTIATLSRSSSNTNSSNRQESNQHVLIQAPRSVFDRLQIEIEKLQNSQETFLNDPCDSHTEEFKKFNETFNPDSQKGAISDLLIGNEKMRAIYTQLVPSIITNELFWSRYFFKVQLAEQENEKRNKLLAKAAHSEIKSEENITWDDGILNKI